MGSIVGVDAGTTALKVGIFDAAGRQLALAAQEYSVQTPDATRAELDGETYWRAFGAAFARALGAPGVVAGDIEAIGVSSQGETITPVDAAGRPIAPTIVWLDNRAVAEADELAARFPAAATYEATGVPAIVPTWPACKLLWWRRNEPTVYRSAARFVLVEDMLLQRLTGRFVSEGGVQCTSLLYDLRAHAWWSPMLDYLEIGPERLPDLAKPGDVVGTLAQAAAQELGLRQTVRVVACGMDQGAGAVGVGNVAPGIVSESTGGALTLQASIDRSDGDASRQTPVYVHSAAGRYLYCPVCPTGGMALTWFRDRFGGAEVERAEATGGDAYDLLTDLAASIAPGADGLTMLPHLMGAFSPEYEPRARGVFAGFTLAHTKGHFVRAILEAVAFMLRRNLDMLSAAGAPASELRSHGGGSRSRLWNTIKADVTGLRVATLEGSEAAVRGDAMLAGVAAGEFADLEEACAAMVATRDVYEPNPASRVAYDDAYRRYLDLFEALRPTFVGSGAARS